MKRIASLGTVFGRGRPGTRPGFRKIWPGFRTNGQGSEKYGQGSEKYGHSCRLGSVLACLRVSFGCFGPARRSPGGPGRLRGMARGGQFVCFLWCSARRSTNGQTTMVLLQYLNVFRPYFYAICCPLLPSLLRGRRHRAYTKNMKFHCFLWVASQMYLFLAAPEASKFQRACVANIDGK